jgi:3-deoxy-D-manno-octulosonic-acid transferase
MRYLFNLLYVVLLLASLPWLVAAAIRQGKYRAGFGQKLLGLVPPRRGDARCVWLHAVSLGEVSLIAPLVEEIRRRHPDWDVAISTTTATGYDLAKKRYGQHTVFYCPLDFSWAVRRAMARIRPTLLLLVELELWPNLIAAAREAGANVAIVNGRLSDRSFRGYARARRFARRLLAKIDLVAAQSPQYADRFLALGARHECTYVTGSLKFDGARTDRENPETRTLAELARFEADDVVFLAGSTQEPEERLALDAYWRLSAEHPRLRLVVVPRHPDRFDEVATIVAASGMPWQRRSELDKGPAEPAARILLVDRVGELAAWWGTARIAYVGGSMGGRQGQNMIEPAAYGAAVSFGPKTNNFRDVVTALLDARAAVVVNDGEELTAFVRRCLVDPEFADRLGTNARRVVMAQLGAAGRTADLVDALVDRAGNRVPRRTAA